MRQIYISIGFALLCVFSGWAKAIVPQTFRLSGPVKVNKPILVDSIDPLGKTYDLSRIIDNRINLSADYTTMVPDADGKLALASSGGTSVYRLDTRLRASKFAKGTLEVSSAVPFKVLVDGKEKASKKESGTEKGSASTKKVKLTLAPELNKDVAIILVTPESGKPEVEVKFVPEKEFEDVPVYSGADLKSRYTLHSTLEGVRATKASLSHDGKYLLINYTETFEPEKRRSWAVLSETATGKVVNSRVVSKARWMPNSSLLYYTEKTPEGYDVLTIDPATGNVALLAEKVPVGSFSFAPGGRYICYSGIAKGRKEDGPIRRYTSPDDRLPGNRDRSYVKIYDLKTGVEHDLTFGARSSSIADVTRDGKRALLTVSEQTPSKYPFYKTTLLELTFETMAVDTLIVGNGEDGVSEAVYSPDGRKIFIMAGPEFAGGIGLNAGDHPIANAYDTQGFLMDIASRKVTALTRDFNPALKTPVIWNYADGKIYFLGEDGFKQSVFSCDPVSGNIRKIEVGIDKVANFSMGDNNAQWLAATGATWNHTGSVALANLKKGTSATVADPMAETLAGIEFGVTEPWNFTNSRGDVIEGYISYPPSFDANKQYPVIVYYYGGTSPSQAGCTSPYSPQVLASRDYIVYVINPSGTTGYGQEFSARHVNAWGKYTADDIIEGVKAFCAAHPFANSKKIGCIGASYGGFMTQYLLTRTDMFAAAVSHAGISNVASYWGEGYWGYSYNSVAAAQSYPWTNPDLFTKHGSLFNADKIHTPLLLLHGTADTNVPVGESIQLFNALKILDRKVELITVDDENHWIQKFPHEDLWHDTFMAWFAKWLQDDPRWWDSLYGN